MYCDSSKESAVFKLIKEWKFANYNITTCRLMVREFEQYKSLTMMFEANIERDAWNCMFNDFYDCLKFNGHGILHHVLQVLVKIIIDSRISGQIGNVVQLSTHLYMLSTAKLKCSYRSKELYQLSPFFVECLPRMNRMCCTASFKSDTYMNF